MAAENFIEEKLAGTEYGFSLENLIAETGLSNVAARNQLLRLRPLVRRISPKLGFYLIVQPEYRRAGSPPVEWWLDDFFRWLGHPYYIATPIGSGMAWVESTGDPSDASDDGCASQRNLCGWAADSFFCEEVCEGYFNGWDHGCTVSGEGECAGGDGVTSPPSRWRGSGVTMVTGGET